MYFLAQAFGISDEDATRLNSAMTAIICGCLYDTDASGFATEALNVSGIEIRLQQLILNILSHVLPIWRQSCRQ